MISYLALDSRQKKWSFFHGHVPVLSFSHAEKGRRRKEDDDEYWQLITLRSPGHPSGSTGVAADSLDTRPAPSPELSEHVPLECHPEVNRARFSSCTIVQYKKKQKKRMYSLWVSPVGQSS